MAKVTRMVSGIVDTGRKVVRLVGAVARHAADDFKNVTNEQFEARLEICRSCEHFVAEAMRCKHGGCGCYLNMKAWWKSEKCPVGKWPAL